MVFPGRVKQSAPNLVNSFPSNAAARFSALVQEVVWQSQDIFQKKDVISMYTLCYTLNVKHLQIFGIPENMSNKVAFLSWKMCESHKIFDWNLFIMLLSMINQHWFKKWHGADLAPGHFLEQWWQKPMLPGVNSRCLWVKCVPLWCLFLIVLKSTSVFVLNKWWP